MALERQITLKTNITKPIDVEVDNFLTNNEVDPAAIQIVIDENSSMKRACLIFAERSELKKLYEKQGRTYSDLDAVTYCHTKDIMVTRGGDIDSEVNAFLSNEDISIISISNYMTPTYQGTFILYVDLPEQKKKMEEKQLEVAKMQEEMAQRLASEAVKNVDLETNDTVERYAEKSDEIPDSQSENTDNENIRTAGLMQIKGEVKEPEVTVTTTTTEQDAVVDTGKKKRFGRK